MAWSSSKHPSQSCCPGAQWMVLDSGWGRRNLRKCSRPNFRTGPQRVHTERPGPGLGGGQPQCLRESWPGRAHSEVSSLGPADAPVGRRRVSQLFHCPPLSQRGCPLIVGSLESHAWALCPAREGRDRFGVLPAWQSKGPGYSQSCRSPE
jgi:hypothetical protein